MPYGIVPVVIEATDRSERAYDIYSRLLKDRIVLLGSFIDDQLSTSICAQLLFLESEDQKKEVNMYINSPGGAVTAGMAIYDTMQYVSTPVITLCLGQAASMAAVLLAAGEPGLRYALPNSRILIHQPLGGVSGQATDIDIQAREILRTKKQLNQILSKHTGKALRKIARDMERDYFMNAEEAQQYGLVDEILWSRQVRTATI